MADKLGISAPYLSEVGKNRRGALGKEKLAPLAGVLGLSEDEKNRMYNLAEKEDPIAPVLLESEDYWYNMKTFSESGCAARNGN